MSSAIHIGTGGPAVYVQMSNMGPQGGHFLDATKSFFKSVSKKHSLFALAEAFQPFNTSAPGFGGLNVCKFERGGDGIRRTAIVCTLSALTLATPAVVSDASHENGGNGIIDGPDTANNRYVSWHPSIMMFMTDNIECQIGQNRFDQLYGHNIAALEALNGTADKPLDTMIGGTTIASAFYGSLINQNLMMDIPLWYSQSETQMFPHIGLNRYDLYLKWTTKRYTDCIVQCNGYRADGSHAMQDWTATTYNYYTNTPTLTNTGILVSYVYFDKPERHFFANSVLEYVINCTQQNQDVSVTAAQTAINVRTAMTFPSFRLFWYFLGSEAQKAHCWGDWSGGLYRIQPQGNAANGQLFADHSFSTLQLMLNSQQRTPVHTAGFYRDQQALYQSGRIPNAFVYQYNWGLDAKSIHDLGYCQLAMIDNFSMNFVRQGILVAQAAVNTAYASTVTVSGHAYTDTQSEAGSLYIANQYKQLFRLGNGVAGYWYNS